MSLFGNILSKKYIAQAFIKFVVEVTEEFIFNLRVLKCSVSLVLT